MLLKKAITFLFLVSVTTTLFAQDKNSFGTSQDDSVVMTWNKDTPESEMKEDVKALSDKGITIKYWGVKRNSKKEITAVSVSFEDRKGNKGSLSYDKQNPIDTIVFYNQNGQIGFGEPSNYSTGIAGNDMFNGLYDPRELMKQFKFNNGGGDSQSFHFSFPDGQNFGQSKSQIRIQKDGKKPLVIENGEITEGGDDYTKEELDEIKKNNKVENFGSTDGFMKEFDFRSADGLEDFKKQMQKMQGDIATPNTPEGQLQQEMRKAKEEMLKAKEEMIKAREEMEQSKKELQKKKQTTIKRQ